MGIPLPCPSGASWLYCRDVGEIRETVRLKLAEGAVGLSGYGGGGVEKVGDSELEYGGGGGGGGGGL